MGAGGGGLEGAGCKQRDAAGGVDFATCWGAAVPLDAGLTRVGVGSGGRRSQAQALVATDRADSKAIVRMGRF